MLITHLRKSDLYSIVSFTTEADASNWTAAKLRECLQHADYQSWVLKENNQSLAYIIINMAGDEAHIMQIAVHLQFRQHGYASQLLKFAMTELQTQNKQKIILEVRADNIAAINLYEKFGFVQIGRRKNYYRINDKKYDALVYEFIFIKHIC